MKAKGTLNAKSGGRWRRHVGQKPVFLHLVNDMFRMKVAWAPFNARRRLHNLRGHPSMRVDAKICLEGDVFEHKLYTKHYSDKTGSLF